MTGSTAVRLGDTTFFNAYLILRQATRPKSESSSWEVAGVTWNHERHIYRGGQSSFQMEIDPLLKSGRVLLAMHEMWWADNRERNVRNARWAHLTSGTRANAERWFKEQYQTQ